MNTTFILLHIKVTTSSFYLHLSFVWNSVLIGATELSQSNIFIEVTMSLTFECRNVISSSSSSTEHLWKTRRKSLETLCSWEHFPTTWNHNAISCDLQWWWSVQPHFMNEAHLWKNLPSNMEISQQEFITFLQRQLLKNICKERTQRSKSKTSGV